jgi:quinolinate synthase
MSIHPLSTLESYQKLTSREIDNRIQAAKAQLGDRLLILGHHYMSDAVIAHADKRGDSFALARIAASARAEFIVFCGVHFMAETADIVTSPEQQVFIPDPTAGCFLADCARIADVRRTWGEIHKENGFKTIPITYVNSGADLKAFCGERGGLVCTSSNAEAALKWAFERGDKVFFFPDQHLGRNTAYKMGIPLDEIRLWNTDESRGSQTRDSIQKARVLLWDGFCDVHQEFDIDYIDKLRKQNPSINIIVHPECDFSVVQAADDMGSTAQIIKTIAAASSGSHWAVGTEKNLVNRLKNEYPDKRIEILQSFEPYCRTMAQIMPANLAFLLEQLVAGNLVNQVKVADRYIAAARKALNRMLELKV